MQVIQLFPSPYIKMLCWSMKNKNVSEYLLSGIFRSLVFYFNQHSLLKQADKLDLLAIFIISRRFAHLYKWASPGQCFLTTYNMQLTNNKKQWAV